MQTLLLLTTLAVSIMPVAIAKQPLTARDALETTRFMTAADARGATVVSVSPDRRRYAFALVRGNVARDGVELEIMAGGLDSLRSAKPESLGRVFTSGLGGTAFGERNASKLLYDGLNYPRWIDNERLAFLWEDEHGVRQIMTVNAITKEWKQITQLQTDIASFSVGLNGELIYVAKAPWSPQRSDELAQKGFVITSTGAVPLLLGVTDGSALHDILWGIGGHYVQSVGAASADVRRVKVGGNNDDTYFNTYYLEVPAIQPTISPDGRWAVVSATAQDVSQDWRKYDSEEMRVMYGAWQRDKSLAQARVLQQPFLISLEDARARPLWNAPAAQRGIGWEPKWAPDSRSLLVGPTFVPIDKADAAGLAGYEMAVVDVATGRFETLPTTLENARKIRDARWIDGETIEISLDDVFVTYNERGGEWKEVGRTQRARTSAPIQIEVRQDPNTPPALYAVDEETGHETMVFDSNPKLRTRFSLGKVKFISWKDADGGRWEGRLYLPVGYEAMRRYPLVIQTRGWGNRNDFSLYGKGGSHPPALGPGWSVFLAQPLAGQGVAVLQVGPSPSENHSTGIHNEAWVQLRGYESGVEYLDQIGLIDPDRVGLMGFSRSGWHAQYALAFSTFRYAAAITDDNIDSGYIEAAMQGWTSPEMRNGAEPFGPGMKAWLENAPTFNVEHVRTPLLMVASGSFVGRAGPVAQGWEMFSRLKHLGKPVEFFVVPNIERGSHNLQNPRQLLALQERAMDWWLYWLKDERDSSEAKREQYVGWDRLRVLRDEDAKKPESPYLRWSAEPVEICDIRQC